MKKTKLYEVANEIDTDTHIMVPEGYAGLTKEDLERMERIVKKADEKRRIRAEQIQKKSEEEEARLQALENQDQDPPWKRQRDRYKKKNLKNRKTVENKPIPEDKKNCKTCAAKGLKRLISGGAKLLKSELGIDAADEETVEKRKEVCIKCPIYDFGVCVEEKGGCGCFCAAKVKLKGEECPKGKW